MATIQIRGRVNGGVIELSEPVNVPDGTEVIVTVAEPTPGTPAAVLSFPEGAMGMWADRTDITDSVEWLQKTREEEWRRRINPD